MVVNYDSEVIVSGEIIESLIDVSWKEYQQIFDDKSELDQKTSILLTGIGIIIGLVITRFDHLNLVFLYLGCVVLVLSVISGLGELRLHRFKEMTSDGLFQDIISSDHLNDPYNMKLSLIETVTECNIDNRNRYEKLVKYAEIEQSSFVLGVFLLLLSFAFSVMF